MPDRYISDDYVTINVQGLRTVQREDWMFSGDAKGDTKPYRLLWSYKGQQNFYRYANEAERDAMYNVLRAVLTEKQRRDKKLPGEGE